MYPRTPLHPLEEEWTYGSPNTSCFEPQSFSGADSAPDRHPSIAGCAIPPEALTTRRIGLWAAVLRYRSPSCLYLALRDSTKLHLFDDGTPSS